MDWIVNKRALKQARKEIEAICDSLLEKDAKIGLLETKVKDLESMLDVRDLEIHNLRKSLKTSEVVSNMRKLKAEEYPKRLTGYDLMRELRIKWIVTYK